MGLRLTKTPRAKLDIIEAAEFLAEDSPRASDRFLASTESTFKTILENPYIGRKWREDREWRVFPVSSFPKYLVFYEVLEGRLRILTLIHGTRDIPGLLEDI